MRSGTAQAGALWRPRAAETGRGADSPRCAGRGAADSPGARPIAQGTGTWTCLPEIALGAFRTVDSIARSDRAGSLAGVGASFSRLSPESNAVGNRGQRERPPWPRRLWWWARRGRATLGPGAES